MISDSCIYMWLALQQLVIFCSRWISEAVRCATETAAPLPQSRSSRIWSWVPRGSEPRMTVLARTSKNLPNPALGMQNFSKRTCKVSVFQIRIHFSIRFLLIRKGNTKLKTYNKKILNGYKWSSLVITFF
jgi:hypothetical protein